MKTIIVIEDGAASVYRGDALVIDWDVLENGECPLCGADIDEDEDEACPECGLPMDAVRDRDVDAVAAHNSDE